MKKLTVLILLSILCHSSCQKEEISLCNTLDKSLANRLDFFCGTVVDLPKLMQNQAYGQIVSQQFNGVTAENIMKPDYLHPSEDIYNWAEADQLADYCLNNEKRLHGHTLIWHQQIPNWMITYQGSKTEWENMLREHIVQIVTHFKGKVTSWDVVNEAFNDDGTLRNTIWKERIGASYIEKAFHYAHEADPDAKLFYNDYSVVINPVKRKAILSFLTQLRAKGTPIHGIGIQMHIFNGFPENIDISTAIDDIWTHDFLVHISELEISMNPLSQDMPVPTEHALDRQADKYLYLFTTYNRIPDRYKFGITIWGVGDGDSWIRYYYNRDDYPLLFDDNYEPKPAYCKLISNL